MHVRGAGAVLELHRGARRLSLVRYCRLFRAWRLCVGDPAGSRPADRGGMGLRRSDRDAVRSLHRRRNPAPAWALFRDCDPGRGGDAAGDRQHDAPLHRRWDGAKPAHHAHVCMKLNVYSDEIATVIASMLLGRPVKFCVDRLESFVSDSQARDHRIKCRISLKKTGEITAMEMDDISAVGAYGMPLRFNVAEGMMAITLAGAPYRFENYQARTRSVYVNKNLIGMYRGVGMPLACV